MAFLCQYILNINCLWKFLSKIVLFIAYLGFLLSRTVFIPIISSRTKFAILTPCMTVLMYWVDPKDHMLKVLCHYIYYWLRYRLNKENRPIVIMPTHPKLTQVPRVIHDILDVVGRPQGSYPESFVSLSLFLAEI